MTGYDIWRIATATSMHFSSNYDAFKFSFKAKNLSVSAYNKRRDKYFFEHAVKKFSSEEEIRRYVFANYFFDEVSWFGDMSPQPYDDYNIRLQSMSYLFRKDLKQFDPRLDFILQSYHGKYPVIMNAMFTHDVMPETVMLIHLLTNFLNVVKVDDELLWPTIQTKLIKGSSFIAADIPSRGKYRNIVLDLFSDGTT